ncbi:MAG: hypothetical protein ABSA26_12490, partial [Thermoguttaceae bacterium]
QKKGARGEGQGARENDATGRTNYANQFSMQSKKHHSVTFRVHYYTHFNDKLFGNILETLILN